ncbi:hypothetical protein D3C77_411260 [compost metagenome]
MTDFEAVAVQLLVMPLQERRAANHLAVVGVVAVVFEIAIIALARVVVQGVVQACVVIELVVDDRAQPAYTLLIAAIGNVVVGKPPACVDLHRIAHRVQNRRAPIGAVFLLFQVLQGQGVTELGRQVAE